MAVLGKSGKKLSPEGAVEYNNIINNVLKSNSPIEVKIDIGAVAQVV